MGEDLVFWRICRLILAASIAAVLTVALIDPAGAADPAPSTIPVHTSLTGPGAFYGIAFAEGARLAVEEANAASRFTRLTLDVLDDHSSDSDARALAEQIGASGALVVVGPDLTTSAIASGSEYEQAGLAAIAATAHGDSVIDHATMFQPIFSTSDMGGSLATYVRRVLGGTRATVLYEDNGFGRPIAAGFQVASIQLGISTTGRRFSTAAEGEAAARDAAVDPLHPVVVLATLGTNAVRVLMALRRAGVREPIVGPDAIAIDSFAAKFANEPEERRRPGFFTEGVYAASALILDSANAATLAVADRFHARFGHDLSWVSAQGYDATRLAIAALRSARVANTAPDVGSKRKAVLAWLGALDGPEHAAPGLTGPLWFTPDRGRTQEIRIGRFHNGSFGSAPLQVVAVDAPEPADIASGAVFRTAAGRFARLQRVVYTGMFLNDIPRIDLRHSSFDADVYVWLRYAGDAGPGAGDPTDISFPNLINGRFDRAHPAEQREGADGTVYQLWRVQGTFRNDFDLHRFPFDRQTLTVPFFNAHVATDRIVYALDRRSGATGDPENLARPSGSGGALAAQAATDDVPVEPHPITAVGAFQHLTQWTPLGARERRDNLVTDSGPGDPDRVGATGDRELSGFRLTVDVRRRALAALSKTLIPLFLITLIMFSSLYLPQARVKEKVTGAIIGALAGAVLLASVNSQLGSIGYTAAVEYAFDMFFGLSTLCIAAALGADHLRATGRAEAAVRTQQWTRVVFLLVVGVVAAGAYGLWVGGASG